MAISGKSSSVAALLLLVAVLAGSCATGANANCVVANTCQREVTLSNVKEQANPLDLVVQSGMTAPLGEPLLEDLKIVIRGKTYILLVDDIQKHVNLNAVAKIEIHCHHSRTVCGKDALFINVYVNIVGQVKLHLAGTVQALLSI